MAAGNPIDLQDGIDTSGFYFQLGVAQVIFKTFAYYLLCIIYLKNNCANSSLKQHIIIRKGCILLPAVPARPCDLFSKA